MSRTFFLKIPSNYSFLPAVVELSHRIFLYAGLDENQTHLLALAVEEAITNAIKHSYKGDQNQWIEVEFTIKFKEEVQIKVRFGGEPIDIPQEEFDIESAAKERKRGGLGLQIMRKATDELCYGKEGEVNWWLLKKKLKG